MRKKVLSITMILTMVLVFGAFAVGSGCGDSGNSSNGTSGASSGSSNSKVSDNNAVGSRDNPLTVGNTMDVNGLKITLNDADLNYTGYDNRYGMHTPQPGMKYIATTFTFQNDKQSDAYVSIYDFACYADGTASHQEYGLEPDINMSNNFMNTNLSPGRNVSFTTYYSVPEGAQSIELEYKNNMFSDKKSYVKLQ